MLIRRLLTVALVAMAVVFCFRTIKIETFG
jgi:hypothetical protein